MKEQIKSVIATNFREKERGWGVGGGGEKTSTVYQYQGLPRIPTVLLYNEQYSTVQSDDCCSGCRCKGV